jgi:heme oxygenase (staphylobilin-producing)
MKVAKILTDAVLEDLNHKSAVVRSEGFIRRDVLLNSEGDEFDLIKVLIYWKDKDSMIRWQGSKEHQQGHIDRHKEKKASGKEPISRKELNITMEDYNVVFSLESEL